MYEPHPDIDTPADETIIWRYMDLPKLLALLRSSSLYLCRLDCLRDPWEGQWPGKVQELLRAALTRDFNAGSAGAVVDFLKQLPKSLFVSCWHESSCESAALWDQYGHSRGLAIRSTIGQMKRSIRHVEPPFFIGRVDYLDYGKPEQLQIEKWSNFNAIKPAFLKRTSFEHEHEVRTLLWTWPSPKEGEKIDWSTAERGKELPVDLDALIDSIYISPESPAWLVEPIQELLRKFDLPDVVVRRSELYDKTIL